MATYFYTKNDDGNMQIDDDYEAIVSIKSGTIYANIATGQIYGLVLTAPATSAGFRIDSGEIFISPPVPYGGTFVVYVATNGNIPIYYEQFARCTDLPKSDHLAGMEIYNSAGKMLFTTKYRTFSAYTGHYARYYSAKSIPLSTGTTVVVKDDADSDIDVLCQPEVAALFYGEYYASNPSIGMELIHKACIENAAGVAAWSCTVAKGGVVQSTTAPWLPSLYTPNDNNRNRVYAAGYKFADNGTKISIGQKMSMFYVTSLLGGGTLTHINKTDKYIPRTGATLTNSMQYGITAHSYIFNIFKPL